MTMLFLGFEPMYICTSFTNIRPITYTKSQRMHFESVFTQPEHVLLLPLFLTSCNSIRLYFSHFIIHKSKILKMNCRPV